MQHADHVRLIEKAITTQGGTWSDLGSGRGAFTLALRQLIGKEGIIYSLDRDGVSLKEQEKAFDEQFPLSNISFIRKDFSENLDLPILDGIMMANSLHFSQDHQDTITHILRYLKPHGVFILVEYNVDTGNQWVPYPLSFQTFQNLSGSIGLTKPKLSGTHPSQFLREIYAAYAAKE